MRISLNILHTGHVHTAAESDYQSCSKVLIRLRLHTVRESQPYSRNTHTQCERNRTETTISAHERELLKRSSTVCYVFSCVVSVTHSDGEMNCVSSFRSNLHQSRSCQFCALCVTQMLHSPPKYYCCRLMKIWWMNSRLDWTLVLSESDKTFSFMDVVIFGITLVTVWLLVRNTGLTLFARSYRQYSRRCCVNGTFQDSHL